MSSMPDASLRGAACGNTLNAQATMVAKEERTEQEFSRKKGQKRTKGGVLASEIGMETLKKCFMMNAEAAAQQLGVGLTVLKRRCRELGIPRWPYRKLKCIDNLIKHAEAANGSDPSEQCANQLRELQQQREMLMSGSDPQFPEWTKKLQQQCSKMNYKVRKATQRSDGDLRGFLGLATDSFARDDDDVPPSHNETMDVGEKRFVAPNNVQNTTINMGGNRPHPEVPALEADDAQRTPPFNPNPSSHGSRQGPSNTEQPPNQGAGEDLNVRPTDPRGRWLVAEDIVGNPPKREPGTELLYELASLAESEWQQSYGTKSQKNERNTNLTASGLGADGGGDMLEDGLQMPPTAPPHTRRPRTPRFTRPRQGLQAMWVGGPHREREGSRRSARARVLPHEDRGGYVQPSAQHNPPRHAGLEAPFTMGSMRTSSNDDVNMGLVVAETERNQASGTGARTSQALAEIQMFAIRQGYVVQSIQLEPIQSKRPRTTYNYPSYDDSPAQEGQPLYESPRRPSAPPQETPEIGRGQVGPIRLDTSPVEAFNDGPMEERDGATSRAGRKRTREASRRGDQN